MGSVTFYNTFSFLYPVIDVFIGGHKKLLANYINALPVTTLLEIGAGNGSHLKYYHAKKVTAIDTSAGMLKLAAAANPNIDCVVMDGENLVFKNECFDCAVLCHVLAVTQNPEIMLSEAYRVVKTGGYVVVLNHFTPSNFLGFADRIFVPFGRLLKFRSVFKLDHLNLLKFNLVSNIGIGKFSYFRLLILQKP